MNSLPAVPTAADRYEDTHLLMDVVDTMRHEKMDNDRLAGEEQSDSALIQKVRDIYMAQGLPVTEAMIRQGLELMKSRRFEFMPPRASMGLSLARIYVTRGTWGPRLALRTAAATALALVVAGTFWAVSAARQADWRQDAQTSVATEQHVRSEQRTLLQRVKTTPAVPQPVADHLRQARTALSESERSLATLPGLATDEPVRNALYERSADQARAILDRREVLLDSAVAHLRRATLAMAEVASIQIAFRDADVFDRPTPTHLIPLRDRKLLAFQTAAEAGQAAGMKSAVLLFDQALKLDRQRETIVRQVAEATGVNETTLPIQLEDARKALGAGNIAAAADLLADVSEKLQILPLSYTLRVVDEQGSRTAVWRYYDGNQTSRSHYILVDAIDATGKPIELSIRSAEDKSLKKTSRFGVRVPQEVYDRIGQDKQSDGVVDQSLFGTKAAGELQPRYEFPILDGMITSW